MLYVNKLPFSRALCVYLPSRDVRVPPLCGPVSRWTAADADPCSVTGTPVEVGITMYVLSISSLSEVQMVLPPPFCFYSHLLFRSLPYPIAVLFVYNFVFSINVLSLSLWPDNLAWHCVLYDGVHCWRAALYCRSTCRRGGHHVCAQHQFSQWSQNGTYIHTIYLLYNIYCYVQFSFSLLPNGFLSFLNQLLCFTIIVNNRNVYYN